MDACNTAQICDTASKSDTPISQEAQYCCFCLRTSALQGPYYLWFASLAAAIYYGYGSYWYTAAISLLAAFNLFHNRGPLQSLASVATFGVSAYVVYQEATMMWVMILIAAQLAHSALRAVLSPLKIAV